MKKTAFLIIFLVVSAAISNAQYFAGGSFGFSTDGGSIDDGTTETEKTSLTTFNLYPKAGYIMSDDLWIGMQIGFGFEKDKTPGAPEVIDRTTQFGFMPFARYYALRHNKFALFAQGQVGIGFSSSETESGGTTVDGPKDTGISFSIFPGLSFDISEKVTLEAQINGFNLGYSYTATKSDVAGTEVKDKSTSFGFRADLDNILTTGFITIGASIKF